MSKTMTTLGWDVGGAHLKAALVNADGVALAVIQTPCPLWRGLNELHKAVDSILSRLNHAADQHRVTMTGELADIFTDRAQGVVQIAGLMAARLGDNTRFYAGPAGLVAGNEVAAHAGVIASANWLASAAFVAKRTGQGLLMDIGSTTADLVLVKDGRPQCRGFSDAERMQFGELIYTGVARTPLMALGSHIAFGGELVPLAAEHFATTSDVYHLTGDLKDAEDMAETADGTGKTAVECARRLARMLGRDYGDAPEAAWIALSRAFKQKQMNTLTDAALRCFSRNLIDSDAPMVGAGAGSFLVRELANQLNREYVDAETLILAKTAEIRRWANVCLPAYALAAFDTGSIRNASPC
jgi:(4-(4-[2-(gamma-L-glutamylamino)ethyl]phenoxymethyl)furan-2-yl)methanamine synthase